MRSDMWVQAPRMSHITQIYFGIVPHFLFEGFFLGGANEP